MADCYWFHQGKCQLFTMPEDMVYRILARVPKARKDLTGCGTACPNVDLAFIEFAENPDTMVEDQIERNEKHMKHVRKYVDYHRHVTDEPGQQPTIPPEKEGGSE